MFSPISYTFYVNYYATAGTTVGKVTASDDDIGIYGVLTYALDQTSLSVEHFAIDEYGEITVQVTPPGSIMGYATSVALTASAFDAGALSDTATVLIIVSGR